MSRLKTAAVLVLLLPPAVLATKVGVIYFSDRPMSEEKPASEYDTRDSFIFGADLAIHARAYLPYKYSMHLSLVKVETGAEKVLTTGHRLEVFPPGGEEPLFTWTRTGNPFKGGQDQAAMLGILPNGFGLDAEGRLRSIESCGMAWGDPPAVVTGAYRVVYTFYIELAGPFEFDKGGYAWVKEVPLAEGSFEFVVH
ncbi:MAG TPA: hypothetical protein ENN88_02800 [Candidatus Coatesbacteria bacterium]|nr:hypothetical protein [Candidatus Coatesbacteria bacterium]